MNLDQLRPYAKYITAAVAGLAAANGVLGVVDGGIVTQLIGLLGMLGLYALTPPTQGPPKPPAVLLLLVCLLGLGLAPLAARPPAQAPAPASPWVAVLAKARPAVVTVTATVRWKAGLTRDRTGAGVAVTRRHVLTAHHVVRGQLRVLVGRVDGGAGGAAVAAEDAGEDLALLRMEPGELKPLPLARGEPALGRTSSRSGTPPWATP
jgi:S1-C subfamily serine protease